MDSPTPSKNSMDFLKEISLSLDNILDVPADQWTQKEINLYHLLQNTLDKYQIRYSLAQFKLDLRDIRNNIKSQGWYEQSNYKDTLNWCLEQLSIKSFQKSKRTGEFKVVARFSHAQAQLTIIFRNDEFYMTIRSPLMECDLKSLDKIAQIFGIDERVEEKKRKEVSLEIVKIIEEIALFYAE